IYAMATDYGIMNEELSKLNGQKSIPGIISCKKGNGKKTTRSSRELHGPVAYRLNFPEELNGVHDTFYVLNFKKCLADPTLQMPLDEIRVDAKLNFIEVPVEILDREFKKLKWSRNAIVKVRWNSKRGPDFTWEREDKMKGKYPHLFSDISTQTDKAPVYDSDGSAEVHDYENCYDNEIFNMFTQEEQYTEILKPIPESHQVPQNDKNIIFEVASVEQSGETVKQLPANVEETRALYDSLYQNLGIEVEKVNTVNRKLKETNADLTTELARFKNQEKCFEISQEKYDKLERCYQ
nr:putative reverse transcriptase domain-containing protein [Tanacetum cinerariifolium]